MPAALLLFAALSADPAEMAPVYRRAAPAETVLTHLAWVDDDRPVAADSGGRVVCVSLGRDEVLWKTSFEKDIRHWSYSPATRRLLVGDWSETRVLDAESGDVLLDADDDALAELAGLDRLHTHKFALHPRTGGLLFTRFSLTFGRHAFLTDSGYRRLTAAASLDATPREVRFSATGNHLVSIADEEVVCVRDIAADKDRHFCGDRVLVEPETHSFTIGPPFASHALFDGASTLLVATDGGCWMHGHLTVRDLEAGTERQFGVPHHHIELDAASDRGLLVVPSRRHRSR